MATNYTDLKGEIKAQIKPNGVGAITGQVLQDAMLNLVGATEAEMSALNAATDEKLAQLDQEWQEIKDANFNVVVKPHIDKVVMEGVTAATIEPDKFYMFGEVPSLSVTFAASEAGYASQYAFQFKSPADNPTSLALPVDIIFTETPVINSGKVYQVSIVEKLAIVTEWSIS